MPQTTQDIQAAVNSYYATLLQEGKSKEEATQLVADVISRYEQREARQTDPIGGALGKLGAASGWSLLGVPPTAALGISQIAGGGPLKAAAPGLELASKRLGEAAPSLRGLTQSLAEFAGGTAGGVAELGRGEDPLAQMPEEQAEASERERAIAEARAEADRRLAEQEQQAAAAKGEARGLGRVASGLEGALREERGRGEVLERAELKRGPDALSAKSGMDLINSSRAMQEEAFKDDAEAQSVYVAALEDRGGLEEKFQTMQTDYTDRVNRAQERKRALVEQGVDTRGPLADTGNRIAATIATALGAMSSAYLGGPNQAGQIIDDSINNSIAEQKARIARGIELADDDIVLARQEFEDDRDIELAGRQMLLDTYERAVSSAARTGVAAERQAGLGQIMETIQMQKAQHQEQKLQNSYDRAQQLHISSANIRARQVAARGKAQGLRPLPGGTAERVGVLRGAMENLAEQEKKYKQIPLGDMFESIIPFYGRATESHAWDNARPFVSRVLYRQLSMKDRMSERDAEAAKEVWPKSSDRLWGDLAQRKFNVLRQLGEAAERGVYKNMEAAGFDMQGFASAMNSGDMDQVAAAEAQLTQALGGVLVD